MATKRTTKSKSQTTTRKQSSRRRAIKEPVAARVLQSSILILGVTMLFVVIFDSTFGPAIVGVLIFATAFPPIRPHVDRWLVGKARGPQADQSAIIRMGLGGVIVILALTGIFPF